MSGLSREIHYVQWMAMTLQKTKDLQSIKRSLLLMLLLPSCVGWKKYFDLVLQLRPNNDWFDLNLLEKKSSTICALLTNQSMNLFLEGLRLLCGTLSSEGRVLRSPASKIEYITRLQLTSRLTKQSWREQHALQSPHQKSQNLSHTWNAKKKSHKVPAQ